MAEPKISLEEAISIVSRAGYAVIAREKIRKSFSTLTVSNADLYRYRGERGFPEHITDRLSGHLARELRGRGLMRLDRAVGDFDTTFTASIEVIPHEVEVDPFLEHMRREDRGR